jgi:Arc/MetJ-type ribon-helix-helix transcriptional regulator
MIEVAIQLPDELSQFVNDSVQSGGYRTKDELFVSVLSIYREQVEASRTEADQSKLADLRRDVQVAVDQLDRGEGIRNRNWAEKLAERHRAHAASHPA